MDRVQLIETKLRQAFNPSKLEITDEGHFHVGHKGHGGMGHFAVVIVAEAFTGKKTLERHRMVYDALKEEMKTEIHALRINATAE